jgi:hypothetical protein
MKLPNGWSMGWNEGLFNQQILEFQIFFKIRDKISLLTWLYGMHSSVHPIGF